MKYSSLQNIKNVLAYNLHSLIILILFMLLIGCGNQNTTVLQNSDFSVDGFLPVLNMDSCKTTLGIIPIFLDYSDALGGFTVPSYSQLNGKGFIYEFNIKNTGQTSKKFRYKIYYQNESYKFPELSVSDSSAQHAFAHENFYGSWEQNSEGFRETLIIPADGQFHKVSGTFRIIGNPRDELRYFSGNVNERWKRNPRVGKYSFLLVVTTPENVNNAVVPSYMSDISIMYDSSFVNPYFYFLSGEGKNTSNILSIPSADTLLVKAHPLIDAGIYIEPADFKNENSHDYFTNRCGTNEKIKKTAVFKQFIHYVDSSSSFNNIPVIADISDNSYSLTEYNWNLAFTATEELVRTMPQTVECPCSEIPIDTVKHSVRLINRAAKWGKWEKQNVGIITRHGFTYGTYTIKIKMAEMLNKYGIWNGLTNAIWLITQSSDTWNTRRACDAEGYILDYYGGNQTRRGKYTSYSEIDFEILKTAAYCPQYIYPPAYGHPLTNPYNTANWNLPYPGESEKSIDEIMVCCTNWDMACSQPANYAIGCHDILYDNSVYQAHRWDYWYKAITEKTPASDNELFASSYYYFQIIWKPEEIIWRIGPEKDKLKVVGYMNENITSIPNNQMLLIISQEYHDTDWWPGSPFPQGYIPFPASDISGEIFELTIE